MNIIKSVKIDGLWGNENPIFFEFDKKFNFIIGKNGCGKTTIVNLMAAILVCDYERLEKIPFYKITIKLQSISSKKNPSIVVTKEKNSGIPVFDIVYEIRDSQKSPVNKFSFENEAQFRQLKSMPVAYRERYLNTFANSPKNIISKLIQTCWLSVHRKNDNDTRDDRKDIPAVDQKLTSMANDLVRYFSAMSKKYEDNTKEFQKKSFLSLITYEKDDQLTDFAKKIDIDTEKKGISEVFELLQLETKEYSSKVQQSYDRFAEARDLLVNNKSLFLSQFFSIFNIIKAHSLVQYYDDLQIKRSDIFLPREQFVSVLNELFEGRKILSISPRNELQVKTRENVDIKLEDLSSGEKQLIIILGEALLQEGEPIVYIADEPELSLHVTWQEQLTTAIIRLNPNAQIVFATHSPDIVGVHRDKVLDMGSLIA